MQPEPSYLATAIEAARIAGAIQRGYFRQPLLIQKKGLIDLVTAADFEVEDAFRRLIAERHPGHTVLGEERNTGNGPSGGRHRWIIDPVDGTTNFAHGLAFFCVSIALEIDGRVELGVVYDPMADELFTAERGEGARLNGEPLRVSTCRDVVDSLLCTGFPYSACTDAIVRAELMAVFDEFLGRTRGVRRLGSAALDLCYVAAGRFDGFWEADLHAWDMAAGALMIEAAGGVVTRYDGGPYSPFGRQIVASNGLLHPELMAILAPRSVASSGGR